MASQSARTPAKKWSTVEPQYLSTTTRSVVKATKSLARLDPASYAPTVFLYRPLGCALSGANKNKLAEQMSTLQRACAAIDSTEGTVIASDFVQQARCVEAKSIYKPTWPPCSPQEPAQQAPAPRAGHSWGAYEPEYPVARSSAEQDGLATARSANSDGLGTARSATSSTPSNVGDLLSKMQLEGGLHRQAGDADTNDDAEVDDVQGFDIPDFDKDEDFYIEQREAVELGCKVRVKGLVAAAHHNGTEGVFKSLNEESGRLTIELATGEFLSVKRINVDAVKGDIATPSKTVAAKAPGLSRARTTYQLQLGGNLLKQLEDHMNFKVAQTPRPMDHTNILNVLESMLESSALGQTAQFAEDDTDAMSESEMEQLLEQLEMKLVQNQALYGYLEVLSATDAKIWEVDETHRLVEDIEGLKAQQQLMEKMIMEVENRIDDRRMEEQALEEQKQQIEQMEMTQLMDQQMEMAQQMQQLRE